MFTLHIICPRCLMHHAISEWPTEAREPVLFTCQPTFGGCGAQALVQPPATDHFPSLEHVFVTPRPVSKQEAAALLARNN
jgi:hypothetical protein